MKMEVKFWQKYREIVIRNNVSPKVAEWYVRWVNAFYKVLPDVSLRERTSEDVQNYINSLVKQNKYKDWQLAQAYNALRILFEKYFALSWARPWPISLFSRETRIFRDVPNWNGLQMQFPDLLDMLRKRLRTLHYAYKTEKSYLKWICRFLTFHGLKNPEELGAKEVKVYLEYLANEREIAANTQRQALNAIVFLYTKALEKPIGDIGPYDKPKLPIVLPVVLTKKEKDLVLDEITGTYALMAGLLYGSGLRLMECVRLRVKDVDFEKKQIVVRNAKGAKDRLTMLPGKYTDELKEHLVKVKKAA